MTYFCVMKMCILKWSFLGWACLGGGLWAQVSDDFNDGNDDGWTRLNPLAGFGGAATFSFPGGNTYRMQAGASPSPEALGQSRVGSLRDGIHHTAFRVSVDIVEAEGALEQDYGILARVSTPGLGTLNGYSATFDSDEERLYLSRVDSEQATTLENVDVPIEEGKHYRMVFHGYQDQLLVEVFDVADLTTPVVSLAGSDGAYSGGMTGLFGSAGLADGTVDVTFDNFVADANSDVDQDGMSDTREVAAFGNLEQAGEADFDGDGRSNAEELVDGSDPRVFDVTGLEMNDELLTVTFSFAEGRGYTLEKSTNLKDWITDEEATFVDEGEGVGRLETVRGSGRKFVRVKVGG